MFVLSRSTKVLHEFAGKPIAFNIVCGVFDNKAFILLLNWLLGLILCSKYAKQQT